MKKKYKSMKKFFVVIGLIALSSLLWAYDRPLVNSLDAITGAGTTINLMWNLPENLSRPLTKLLVYRDTQPLSTFEQTKKMTPVAELSPSKTAWQDSVSDFNDYYYAVVCVTDKPYDIIMPSINATVRGVNLTGKRISKDQVIKREEKKYPAGTLRETPLPYLDILDEKKNTELSISKKVSNEARQLGISVNRFCCVLSILPICSIGSTASSRYEVNSRISANSLEVPFEISVELNKDERSLFEIEELDLFST